MKKFSMLLFFAVTLMCLASCGGASKKSEAKTEEVKECCLPIGFKRIRWTKGKELTKASITTIGFMVGLGLYFYAIDMLVSLLRSVA